MSRYVVLKRQGKSGTQYRIHVVERDANGVFRTLYPLSRDGYVKLEEWQEGDERFGFTKTPDGHVYMSRVDPGPVQNLINSGVAVPLTTVPYISLPIDHHGGYSIPPGNSEFLPLSRLVNAQQVYQHGLYVALQRNNDYGYHSVVVYKKLDESTPKKKKETYVRMD
jgi:hypothetical protein